MESKDGLDFQIKFSQWLADSFYSISEIFCEFFLFSHFENGLVPFPGCLHGKMVTPNLAYVNLKVIVYKLAVFPLITKIHKLMEEGMVEIGIGDGKKFRLMDELNPIQFYCINFG